MSRTQRHNRTAPVTVTETPAPVTVTETTAKVDSNEPDTTAAPVEVTAPAPTKQQLLDAARKVARQAKADAKAAQKAANLAKRLDGVIGTIRKALENPNGTTRKETLDLLVAKFPDRDPMGMVVTVGIQFSRLAKSTGVPIENYKVEGRGRVYGFSNTLVRPAVVAVGTPAQGE
jgi:hypothetical protein